MNFYSLTRNILKNKHLKTVCTPGRILVKKYWEWRFKGDYSAQIDKKQRIYFGKPLNLVEPQTMYDKLIWMEQHCDVSEWSRLTDKISVRDFVTARGFGDILNQVGRVWDEMPAYEEFVAALPNTCVVKTTHSGGGEGVAIIHDKAKTDLRKVYRRINNSFLDDFGTRTGQYHYRGIKPRVMVEPLLTDKERPERPLDDYKFFCINGEPEALNFIYDRDLVRHSYKELFLDMDMKPFDCLDQHKAARVPKPAQFERMKEIARRLAQGFPFVRVDLYLVDGKVYFGEMTFTPGFDFFVGTYADKQLKWGQRIDLSMAKVREF